MCYKGTLEEHRALELKVVDLEAQRDSLKKETDRLDKERETATRAVEEANARAMEYKKNNDGTNFCI